jgi:hypothetical protein
MVLAALAAGVMAGRELVVVETPRVEYVTDPAICRLSMMEATIAARQVRR